MPTNPSTSAARRVRCDKTCTADCGRCKGDPIRALKRELRLALAFSRDAHGGVPFLDKPRWQQGHAEAVRAVARVLDEF